MYLDVYRNKETIHVSSLLPVASCSAKVTCIASQSPYDLDKVAFSELGL